MNQRREKSWKFLLVVIGVVIAIFSVGMLYVYNTENDTEIDKNTDNLVQTNIEYPAWLNASKTRTEVEKIVDTLILELESTRARELQNFSNRNDSVFSLKTKNFERWESNGWDSVRFETESSVGDGTPTVGIFSVNVDPEGEIIYSIGQYIKANTSYENSAFLELVNEKLTSQGYSEKKSITDISVWNIIPSREVDMSSISLTFPPCNVTSCMNGSIEIDIFQENS